MESYYKDGVIYTPVPKQSIMVASKSELDELECEPTTVAYTAGYKNMWQLDASGTWQTITEEAADNNAEES